MPGPRGISAGQPWPWDVCSLHLLLELFFFPTVPGELVSTSPAFPVLQIVHAHCLQDPGLVGYLLFSDFFLSDPLGQGQEEALEVSFPFSVTCELVFFA